MTGEELKKLRTDLGMTQKDFGKLFGYHHPQVRMAEFEMGTRNIPRRVADACAYMRNKKEALTGTIPEPVS